MTAIASPATTTAPAGPATTPAPAGAAPSATASPAATNTAAPQADGADAPAQRPAVVVIGALQQEVDLIREQLQDPAVRTDALGQAVCGTYANAKVAATVAGMGTVNAAAATQHMIDAFHPQAVIFSGIAGGLNPALHIADVLVGRTLRYTDTDTALIAESAPGLEEFASTPALVTLAEQVLAARGYEQIPSSASNAADGPAAYLAQLRNTEAGGGAAGDKSSSYGGHPGNGSPAPSAAPSAPEPQRFLTGCVATGNRFVTGEELRTRALEQTHGDCAEMEGAAIAHVCARNGVDCLVLRAISDNCDEAYDAFCERSFDIADYARSASALVLGIIERLA